MLWNGSTTRRLWPLVVSVFIVACADATATQLTESAAGEGTQASTSTDGVQSGATIWLSDAELAARPTSGAAWDAVLRDAARDPGPAAMSDQHSLHDAYTMAAALVCARTGQYCDKARAQLLAAIGTEAGADWLSVSRNLGAYVIAADMLGLRADGNPSSDGTRVQQWIASFLTRTDILDNTGSVRVSRPIGPFHSGSNAAAQEGFIHAAVAAYLADRAALERSWDAFRTFSCDPSAPDREKIDLDKGVEFDWEHSETAPCAINPRGTTKVIPNGRPGAGQTYRIDGALINDMRRGGMYQWAPGLTQYPWTGLQGYVPAALILHRAGYPAFEVGDRAVHRTIEFLKYLQENTPPDTLPWFDGVRGAEVIQLVNWYYKSDIPMNKRAVGASRTFGYTDWTHPVSAPVTLIGTPNREPIAVAGGPYSGAEGETLTLDGSGTSDPDGDHSLSYSWAFGDGASGAGVQTSHAYASDGDYMVTLVVRDAAGATSAPATTTARIRNAAPTVRAGSDSTITVGAPFTVRAGVTDPGIHDTPWMYTITWGDGAQSAGSVESLTTAIADTHTYTAAASYPIVVTVADKDGGTGSDTLMATVVPATPTDTTAPVAPPAPPALPQASHVLVGAGDIASCSNGADEATAKLLDAIPGTVMTLGDNAYKTGSAGEFTKCYGPTWGRHKARTRPAAGERDHSTSGATGYFGYFGAAAGNPGEGYYSYALGAWHVVVLNSEIAISTTSAQYAWLQADLEANPRRCVIAYWHRPYYSSSTGVQSTIKPLWELLQRHGVDVVVNAHNGYYERFAPQTADGVATAAGIRQFTVGTGGAVRPSAPKTRLANSEVLNAGTQGVLKLTLADGHYQWQFVPIAGKTFTDGGTGSCGGG